MCVNDRFYEYRSRLSCPASELSSQSDCDDVSTFRTAQKYSRETPKQSSTLPLPNSAIRVASLMRAGQTFQQATQVQTLRLCPNQGWPRHRPDKLANTQQNPAFTQLNIHGGPKLGLPATRSRKRRRGDRMSNCVVGLMRIWAARRRCRAA